jgi:hypothetical protein
MEIINEEETKEYHMQLCLSSDPLFQSFALMGLLRHRPSSPDIL